MGACLKVDAGRRKISCVELCVYVYLFVEAVLAALV